MKQDIKSDPMEEEPPIEDMEDDSIQDRDGDNVEEEELNEDEAAEFSVLNRQLDQLDELGLIKFFIV